MDQIIGDVCLSETKSFICTVDLMYSTMFQALHYISVVTFDYDKEQHIGKPSRKYMGSFTWTRGWSRLNIEQETWPSLSQKHFRQLT